MGYKKDDLLYLTWLSRFWALYSNLPETLQEGFSSLVLSISKEIETERNEHNGDYREQAAGKGSR